VTFTAARLTAASTTRQMPPATSPARRLELSTCVRRHGLPSMGAPSSASGSSPLSHLPWVTVGMLTEYMSVEMDTLTWKQV
jgi:hypothetical protein